jgi:hypothetical protein
LADIIVDGKIRIFWVTTISNIAAPTTTELDAGIRLDSVVTPDGLVGFEGNTANVDTSAINSRFDTKRPGRVGFDGTMLRLKKQTGTDTAYDTLTYETEGHVVVRRDTLSDTAWASSDDVEVYPAVCGEVRFLAPEANTVRRYEVPMMISAQPELRAVVA